MTTAPLAGASLCTAMPLSTPIVTYPAPLSMGNQRYTRENQQPRRKGAGAALLSPHGGESLAYRPLQQQRQMRPVHRRGRDCCQRRWSDRLRWSGRDGVRVRWSRRDRLRDRGGARLGGRGRGRRDHAHGAHQVAAATGEPVGPGPQRNRNPRVGQCGCYSRRAWRGRRRYGQRSRWSGRGRCPACHCKRSRRSPFSTRPRS